MSEKQAKTREEYKQLNNKEEVEPERTKRVRTRLIPIWLRFVILLVLIAASLIAGAMVGYGPIGGGKATDVLKETTWTHIRDLVEKK